MSLAGYWQKNVPLTKKRGFAHPLFRNMAKCRNVKIFGFNVFSNQGRMQSRCTGHSGKRFRAVIPNVGQFGV